MKTHWKKLHNPDFLGAWDLDEGQDMVLNITSVTTEKVKNSDGKEEDCIVLKTANTKPFILNATNAKTITKVLGSPYIEDWAGQSIQVFSTKVRAFGDVVDALRVRPTKPKQKLRELNADEFARMLEAISAGKLDKAQAKDRYALTPDQLTALNATK